MNAPYEKSTKRPLQSDEMAYDGRYGDTLAIVCWLWGDKYTSDHVNVLYRAVKQNLKKQFRFYCITDRVSSYFDFGINVIPIWDDFAELGLQYRRLRLLDDGLRWKLGDRILQLDLEMLILKDFTHLITNEPFKIWKCPSNTQKGFMYNTSMMLMNTGVLHNCYVNFQNNPAKEIRRKQDNAWPGTDQAVISNYIHPAKSWTQLDGIYSYKMHIEKPGLSGPPADAIIVGLYGKNYDPVKLLNVPWIKEYWEQYTGTTYLLNFERLSETERKRLLEGTWK